MSTAGDLCTMLEGAGKGTFGQTLFAGHKAQVPDTGQVTVVIEYGTSPPDERQDDPGWALGRPRCQVVTHDEAYETADAQARACALALAAVRNVTVGSTRYLSVRPLQTPFDLGPDAAQRARVAFNVEATRAD